MNRERKLTLIEYLFWKAIKNDTEYGLFIDHETEAENLRIDFRLEVNEDLLAAAGIEITTGRTSAGYICEYGIGEQNPYLADPVIRIRRDKESEEEVDLDVNIFTLRDEYCIELTRREQMFIKAILDDRFKDSYGKSCGELLREASYLRGFE